MSETERILSRALNLMRNKGYPRWKAFAVASASVKKSEESSRTAPRLDNERAVRP